MHFLQENVVCAVWQMLCSTLDTACTSRRARHARHDERDRRDTQLSLLCNVCKVTIAVIRLLKRITAIITCIVSYSLISGVHIYFFVTSRIDYCNSVIACAPKALTDKLQRVLSAAALVTSDTDKYEHGLSQILHEKLHWLDVRD